MNMMEDNTKKENIRKLKQFTSEHRDISFDYKLMKIIDSIINTKYA